MVALLELTSLTFVSNAVLHVCYLANKLRTTRLSKTGALHQLYTLIFLIKFNTCVTWLMTHNTLTQNGGVAGTHFCF